MGFLINPYNFAVVGPVGGWVELGRTTLGAAAASITVSSLANKRYYMILFDKLPSGNFSSFLRLGNGSVDSGSNYAFRTSQNGGADGTTTSTSSITNSTATSDADKTFSVMYVANYSSKEKLLINNTVSQETAGAGTAPDRAETVGKWTNTSNVINLINSFDNGAGGNLNTGSEVVVLGWDPADTHTTNFWTELASVDWSSGGTIDSGTFTAKKYLWVQGWWKGNDSVYIRANNDSASNYSWRYSSNGGAEGTATSISGFTHNFGFDSNIHFINMFIINNSANEKLVISHTAIQNTAGAGNAPIRFEAVSKWANTSSQITSLKFMTGSGNFTGGTIKVYGSN